jgi:predicted MFS family arabinose efflux permease
MAMTTALPAFIVIRFAAGFASAFGFVFLSTVVFARLAAMGRAELQPLFFFGPGLGIAASSLMTGGISLVDGTWWQGWIGAAVLMLAGAVAALVLVDRGPPATMAPVHEPRLPRSTALKRMMWAYSLFGAGYIVTMTFLIAIVRGNGTSPLAESGIWLAVGLAAIVSIPVWRWAGERLGPISAFSLACLVEALGVAASVMIGGAVGPLVSGLLLGGTFVGITALGLVAARRIAAAAPRRVLALMTVGFSIGQIAGPLAAGVLADLTGSFLVPSLGAALLLVAAAAIAWPARADPALDAARAPQADPPGAGQPSAAPDGSRSTVSSSL